MTMSQQAKHFTYVDNVTRDFNVGDPVYAEYLGYCEIREPIWMGTVNHHQTTWQQISELQRLPSQPSMETTRAMTIHAMNTRMNRQVSWNVGGATALGNRLCICRSVNFNVLLHGPVWRLTRAMAIHTMNTHMNRQVSWNRWRCHCSRPLSLSSPFPGEGRHPLAQKWFADFTHQRVQ